MCNLFRISTRKSRRILQILCLGMASYSINTPALEQADIEKLERQIAEERERLDAPEEQLNQLKSKGDTEEKYAKSDYIPIVNVKRKRR